jgi:hypothetical protein
MGEPTPATPASKYFAAAVAMIAGAFFFAIGAGLLPIPGGPSNLHGPLWLLLCVGLAFFLAGVAIIVQMLGRANDSGDLPAGTPFWLRATQYLIGLCIFSCFGAISSWIAFGPGERQIQRDVHVRRCGDECGDRTDLLRDRRGHHLAVHGGLRRLRLPQAVRPRRTERRLILLFSYDAVTASVRYKPAV